MYSSNAITVGVFAVWLMVFPALHNNFFYFTAHKSKKVISHSSLVVSYYINKITIFILLLSYRCYQHMLLWLTLLVAYWIVKNSLSYTIISQPQIHFFFPLSVQIMSQRLIDSVEMFLNLICSCFFSLSPFLCTPRTVCNLYL